MRKKYTKKKTTYVPTYKDGGQTKQDFISAKIEKLINEGYNKDQAAAISFSMWERGDHMQDGGTKQVAPRYGVESMFPIVYMEKTVQPEAFGGTGELQGYNAYYKNPNSPDFNPESDKVFYTNDEIELKRKMTQPTSMAAGEYDPYVNSYFNKTKGQVNKLVTYQNGGYNSGVYLNPNTGMYERTPAYNLLSAAPPTVSKPTNTQRWLPGQLPETNWSQTSPTVVAPVAAATLPQGESVQVQQRPQLTAAEDVTVNQLAPATTNTLNVQEQIKPAVQTLNREGQQYLGTTSPPTNDNGSNQPFQFFNPYGGVDLETASTVLGQGIANKDPWSIVGGGLKLATGLGRNILGGLGAQNRQNQIMKDFAEKERDVITQANRPRTLREQGIEVGQYQEGGEIPQEQGSQEEQIFMQVAGMLQQGATPEDVMQQLLQMGLSQEQSAQIIEMVMQELQGAQQAPPQQEPMMEKGGTFDIEALKGKRIKDYTYNKDKDTYTISYED